MGEKTGQVCSVEKCVMDASRSSGVHHTLFNKASSRLWPVLSALNKGPHSPFHPRFAGDGAGQVMAFWGKDGRLYVLSLENAFPDPARIIRPIVSVRLPGIDKAEVTADKPFKIVSRTADVLSVATSLGPEEMCLYVITPEGCK